MKTFNVPPAISGCPSSTRRPSIRIQSRFPWIFLTALCVLLGMSRARGQVWLQSAGSGYGYNYGAQCDTACPFVVRVDIYSNSFPVTPWTMTLTDGNTVTPHSVTASSLQHDSVIPLATLLTGSSAIPTLDLTGLDPGTGTLVITDPSSGTTTIPFHIVNCASGSALLLQIQGGARIAPTGPVSCYVQVINLGPNPSVPVTLEVNGILPVADCTVTPITAGLTVVNLGTSQKVTVAMGALAAGSIQSFGFQMQATPSAVMGTLYNLVASFASTYPYTASQPGIVVASLDPNVKYGPVGTGSKHSISSNSVLPYVIKFENDPSALAAAQIVTITDYLDTTKVNPLSFGFGPVFYGNEIVMPPAGANPFSVTVPYDVDGDPMTTIDNIYVRISGSVNQNQFGFDYGKVVWMFESLDAPNGNPPPIGIGFLPPNLVSPEGEGGVTYSVDQRPNLAGGTLITNVASIVFDVNPAISTPVWTNRIAIPSTLSINGLGLSGVRVTWSGGVLEQADTVTGPDWSDAPVQVSPWTFPAPGTNQQKFFRVRND
jgi:hypothetical protein